MGAWKERVETTRKSRSTYELVSSGDDDDNDDDDDFDQRSGRCENTVCWARRRVA